MAVLFSNLTLGSSNVDGGTFTTASVTPTSNALQLLTVHTITRITSNPVIPTVTGNGLTWGTVNSGINDPGGSSRRRTTLFKALGASPSAGSITLSFGTQTQTSISWCLDEATSVNTITPTVQNVQNTVIGATSLIGTLAAFASADNATYGAFGISYGGATNTEGSGFTKLGSVVDLDGDVFIVTEYRADNDTTVNMTFGTAIEDATMTGVEINFSAPLGTSTFLSRLNLLGVG